MHTHSSSTNGPRAPKSIEPRKPLGFFRLVWSDYCAHFAERPEPATRAALKLPLRLLFNPSLQLALLVRLAQRGPGLIHHPIRWLQVAIFSSECYWFRGSQAVRIEIGPGINFPHPSNIIVGAGTKIGAGVTIYNNVTVGTDVSGVPNDVSGRAPIIGDGVFIYGYANVQGPRVIGRRAVIGKWVVVQEDVPAGALATARGIRREEEWDRSRIWPGESPHRADLVP